jgi:hypothetical protein
MSFAANKGGIMLTKTEDPLVAEVRAFIAETGIRGTKLGDEAGLNNSYVSAILNRRRRPNSDSAVKLRVAMATLRAEIKARIEKAQRDGARRGRKA